MTCENFNDKIIFTLIVFYHFTHSVYYHNSTFYSGYKEFYTINNQAKFKFVYKEEK